MLSEDPPWAADDCHRTAGLGHVAYSPDIGTEKLADSCEIENKLLDGKSPATVLEKLKICLSILMTRKNKIIPENTYSYKRSEKYKISASTDGGPRSWFCARETLRSAPHRCERKFSGACVWSGGLKFSTVFLINFLAKSGNSKHFLF